MKEGREEGEKGSRLCKSQVSHSLSLNPKVESNHKRRVPRREEKPQTFEEGSCSNSNSTRTMGPPPNLFNFILFLNFTNCISFAKYQNESTTGIHVFPILNPPPSSLPVHPSGSSQCTSPKHSVLCIQPGLATHFIYDIIHVSIPFSQIIPPSPCPTESRRLFYTSVSPLLSRTPGYCQHLSKFHI